MYVIAIEQHYFTSGNTISRKKGFVDSKIGSTVFWHKITHLEYLSNHIIHFKTMLIIIPRRPRLINHPCLKITRFVIIFGHQRMQVQGFSRPSVYEQWGTANYVKLRIAILNLPPIIVRRQVSLTNLLATADGSKNQSRSSAIFHMFNIFVTG